jgi:hypothetical protein
MARHIHKCLSSGTREGGVTILLRAEPTVAKMYWLDIAAQADAKLKDIDRLLRRVWLECCGHLSQFSGARHEEVSMGRRVAEAFGVGSRLTYVYDFGSSTELVVTGTALLQSPLDQKARVVARNEPLSWPCDVCGKPATSLCVECASPDGGFFCAKHARVHECGPDTLLPVVNSPRMGVCGYTG